MATRQDLIRKFQEFQDRIHALMEDAVVGSGVGPGHAPWSPAVDAYETEREFVLTVEVPGIERGQVELQIRDNLLSIRGHRNPCAELSKQVYYRLERPSGSFERTFALPQDVDPDKVCAQLSEGVLTVTLPKKARRLQPFKVQVKKRS
jgi:HSP20 family protein